MLIQSLQSCMDFDYDYNVILSLPWSTEVRNKRTFYRKKKKKDSLSNNFKIILRKCDVIIG